jgi:TRAP-type uncharacterized transport system substrate-binding protein
MGIEANVSEEEYRGWLWWVAALVTVAVVIFSAVVLFRPLPPREFVLATGPPGGAYEEAGRRYQALLAKQGVQLRLRATAGAIENLTLLDDGRSGVSAGFVQSGTTSEGASPDLVSLGAVFNESLWFFCRCQTSRLAFHEMEGRKISIGPEGSATRALSLKLLTLNQVDTSRLSLLALPLEEAAQRLLDGTIDASVMLTWWDSPVVRRLLASPDVNLIGYPRADAYVVLFPFLEKVVIPMGVGNLALNRPPEDVTILRAKASLVVRKDLHPALQYVLIQAAQTASSTSLGFDPSGSFPAAVSVDLPLSDEAASFYKRGPGLLQRNLPFWLAELIERLAVGLLPLFGVLFPLWSIAPRAFGWYMNRRIYRHYQELKQIEREAHRQGGGAWPAELRQRLARLEKRVTDLQAPAAFAAAKYQLKSHIRQAAESDRGGTPA